MTSQGVRDGLTGDTRQGLHVRPTGVRNLGPLTYAHILFTITTYEPSSCPDRVNSDVDPYFDGDQVCLSVSVSLNPRSKVKTVKRFENHLPLNRIGKSGTWTLRPLFYRVVGPLYTVPVTGGTRGDIGIVDHTRVVLVVYKGLTCVLTYLPPRVTRFVVSP